MKIYKILAVFVFFIGMTCGVRAMELAAAAAPAGAAGADQNTVSNTDFVARCRRVPGEHIVRAIVLTSFLSEDLCRKFVDARVPRAKIPDLIRALPTNVIARVWPDKLVEIQNAQLEMCRQARADGDRRLKLAPNNDKIVGVGSTINLKILSRIISVEQIARFLSRRGEDLIVPLQRALSIGDTVKVADALGGTERQRFINLVSDAQKCRKLADTFGPKVLPAYKKAHVRRRLEKRKDYRRSFKRARTEESAADAALAPAAAPAPTPALASAAPETRSPAPTPVPVPVPVAVPLVRPAPLWPVPIFWRVPFVGPVPVGAPALPVLSPAQLQAAQAASALLTLACMRGGAAQ